MRARIAERLKEAQNTAASLTTFNEIDMSALMAFRAKYKDQVMKEHGIKLGFMSAFVKASTVAMKELPAVNASIVGEGNSAEIVYRDYVDVSVAVSTPKGLVTPVLRNAESYDFVGIEREIAALGKKVHARDRHESRGLDRSKRAEELTRPRAGPRRQAHPGGHDRRLVHHVSPRTLSERPSFHAQLTSEESDC